MRDSQTCKLRGIGNITIYTSADIAHSLIDVCAEYIDTPQNKNLRPIKDAVFYNPDFCMVLIDNDTLKPVAFLFFLPISEKTNVDILNHKMNKESLIFDSFDYDNNKNNLYLYLYSAWIDTRYANEKLLNLLEEIFVDISLKKLSSNKYIELLYFNNSSKFEKYFIEKFHAHPIDNMQFQAKFDVDVFKKSEKYEELLKKYQFAKNKKGT